MSVRSCSRHISLPPASVSFHETIYLNNGAVIPRVKFYRRLEVVAKVPDQVGQRLEVDVGHPEAQDQVHIMEGAS